MNFPDNFFDVAVGNVPFGQFKVQDRRYDRLNLSIHEYFFAKTLDKVRPGGVVAFVTSSYTMDKRTGNVRKYIAQRAELLGAIRACPTIPSRRQRVRRWYRTFCSCKSVTAWWTLSQSGCSWGRTTTVSP